MPRQQIGDQNRPPIYGLLSKSVDLDAKRTAELVACCPVQKQLLTMQKIQILNMKYSKYFEYEIFKIFVRGSMTPNPPRGVVSFSPVSPLTRFHAWGVFVSLREEKTQTRLNP